MLETFVEIWNLILKSNLFNFVLMLFLLAWIFKKCNLAENLEKGRKSIENKILSSKEAKEKALTDLYEVQSKTKEVDDEIFSILDRADKNAKLVGEKLVKNAEESIQNLNSSLQKIIDTNAKTLNLKLTNKTVNTVIAITKQHIQKELESDKSLHMKFINDSIDALKGVNFNE